MEAYLSGFEIESTYMIIEDAVYTFMDTCYMAPKTYHDYLTWIKKIEKECPLLKELR